MSSNGIGSLNESSLHAELKEWLFKDGDKTECPVDGYVVDLVRDDLLIEIQTRNFSSIKKKLKKLLKKHPIRLVYPLVASKWIVYIEDGDDDTPDTEGKVLLRRKAPVKGKIHSIFKELMRLPEICGDPNFSFQVLFIFQDEIRCDDGKGSWRRKGVSIINKKLVEVIDSRTFTGVKDYLDLLPEGLPDRFTNKMIAKTGKINIKDVRKMTYSLGKMGALVRTGEKKGNEIIYERNSAVL